MADLFEDAISRLMLPMEELGPGVSDTTFFLKDTGSFVYAEGYWHPPGQFYGKIVYYPRGDGAVDIHGRRYECLTKEREGEKRVLVPHDRQLREQYRVDPGLLPPPARPLVTEYHHPFELRTMRGWFSGRRSMRDARERFPDVDACVRELSDMLEVPQERIGAAGALAFGCRDEEGTLNLVFSGTPEENMDAALRVRRLTYADPKRRCVEFGKFWPLRIVHGGMTVCCFFAYSDRGRIPVCGQEIEAVREPVEVFGTIADTLHSIYMPVVLRLGDVYLDGARAEDLDLIVADSSLRGEFYPNERVHVSRGRLVALGRGGERAQAVVAVDAGDLEKERFVKGVPAF